MNSLDIKQLLPELKKLVTFLAEDLLKRVNGDTKINDGLKEAFKQIEKGGRTAQAYEVWLEDYLDQVAVAWVLACVFVRFMEDNGLFDECWLAGEGERRKLAEDSHTLYFRDHPRESDREYFQHVFHEVGKIPAAADLFSEGKTPLWAVAPSGDAAMQLLKFWREQVEDMDNPPLKRSFKVEGGDTRFLGDLYQELSEKAKKKYALLQTPVFVEEFILDRTLTPAIDEFSLEKVRMIDPTCGSGHFLLGAFDRLFKLWSRPEHTTGNAEKDAQSALDGVWGVDINPFAVAIARFRLIVAAVQACEIKSLKLAHGWKIHLASGDSLLFGGKPTFNGERSTISRQLSLFDVPDIYAVEDRKTLQQILGQGYHVVVGNPPYITVKDKVQNEAYRQLYSTCHRKYSLGVPFTQRFWELAVQQGEVDGGCGYVGMITANSFMKREFGKKLIEEFFSKIDLTHVIDMSGAYVPGHGTPTVILQGRSRKPVGESVRAVLGINGEPSTPEDPSQGLVWKSIVKQIDIVGVQDAYTSTADVPRTTFNSHPWSIGGGGASDLKEQIEEGRDYLEPLVTSIGFFSIPGDEDVFVSDSRSTWTRQGISISRPMVTGDGVRDWLNLPSEVCIYPYNEEGVFSSTEAADRHFWKYRSILRKSLYFGKTREQRGMEWREFAILLKSKMYSPFAITFTNVATHNHFVLDRSLTLFDSHAPIIKLPVGATEDEHLSILGLLNSSTSCFWIKQTFHNKGSTVDQHGARQRTAPFEDFYEISGTGLQRFPLAQPRPLILAQKLDELAQQYAAHLPESVAQTATPTYDRISNSRNQAASIRGQMIALQEELDWYCYLLYGLVEDDLRYTGDDLPEIAFGERAFEIVMARQMANEDLNSTWFVRHGATSVSEIPTQWPEDYRTLVRRRIKMIETSKEIALIERPENKRRWNDETWQTQEQRALKNWLLDRLETPRYRKCTNDNPELTTTALMADVASADTEFLQVASLYRSRPDFDVSALVAELVEGEVVPFLPILRYKPAGLRKRELWERTWDLQRQADAGKPVGEISLPPKYATADFLKTDFWRLRGKLDVPKERWISFPLCSTESDPTLVVGWAGWNHVEQATAIVAYYEARKREGWTSEQLKPLLAGLDQLIPWIHQWHPEVDPEFGETAAQSFQNMLESDAHELGLTLDDIRNWTLPEKQTKASKKKAKEQQ